MGESYFFSQIRLLQQLCIQKKSFMSFSTKTKKQLRFTKNILKNSGKLQKHKYPKADDNRMTKKSQMSVEYLFVIAFAMGIVLVTAYAFFVQTRETSTDQQLGTIEVIARDVLSNAKNVYYAGPLSKKTVRYTMPTIVNNVSVSGDNALVFSVTTEGASYELTYYSDVPIAGNFPASQGYTQQITHILVMNNGTTVLLCTEEFGCS